MREWSTLKKLIWLKGAKVIGAASEVWKTISNAAIATFTAIVSPLRQLVVAIEPVQNLNGYDNPWPAGGGKNKWVPTETKTIGSLSFTTNADGSVVVNGSTSSYTSVQSTGTLAEGTYTLRNGLSSNQNVALAVFNGSTALAAINYGSQNFTLSEATEVKFRIYVNNASASNVKVYPMVCLSSESADFAPYSNICPISGWTEANVFRTGVNVWDEETESGGIDPTTGQNASNPFQLRTKNYISVFPNEKLYVKHPVIPSISNISIRYYKSDKTYIGYNPTAYINQVLTIPNDCYYIRFSIQQGYGTTYNNDISINYPSTDTDYHAYNGNTYTIDLDGTRYGGTLDVLTGVLTVDRAYVDLGTLDYVLMGNTSKRQAWQHQFSDIKKTTSGNTALPAISSQFKAASMNASWSPGMMAPPGLNSSYVCFCVNSGQYADATEFKTAMSGVQFVYELETPQTVQLTAQQVSSLLGANNVWADTGNVTVEYRES